MTGCAIALTGLIPVALILGWLVAGRFLKPLRAITNNARRIGAGNLDRRLGLGEPADELTELGHTLDDLLARLEAAFDAQRHFVANASHELRTPLAGQRTLLEVAIADPDADTDTLRTVCREALSLGGQQERLIKALLVLATSERGISDWSTVDLAGVADRVLAGRRDRAAEHGVAVHTRLSPAATSGDPRLIESLVANLIDNGVRHNHPGGQLTIACGAFDGHAWLEVVNSGPVVPDDQVHRLLQPFQRLEPGRRAGHGLGLSIIDAVARAHHADLTVRSRDEGGLAITVRFRAPAVAEGGVTDPQADRRSAGRRPGPR